jgi:hypothetical protein
MGLYRSCGGGRRGRRASATAAGSANAPSCGSIARRLHAACGALFALYLTASWAWAGEPGTTSTLLRREPALPLAVVTAMGLLAAATACARCDPAGLFAGLLRAASGVASALLAARAISVIDRDTTGPARGRLLVTFCLALSSTVGSLAAAAAPWCDKVKGD